MNRLERIFLKISLVLLFGNLVTTLIDLASFRFAFKFYVIESFVFVLGMSVLSLLVFEIAHSFLRKGKYALMNLIIGLFFFAVSMGKNYFFGGGLKEALIVYSAMTAIFSVLIFVIWEIGIFVKGKVFKGVRV